MRTTAIVLLLLALAGQATRAQSPSSAPSDLQVAACKSWSKQVRATVGRLNDHGLLDADETAAVNNLIEIMGHRCSRGDAGRISVLYAILLDTLVDQRHQP